ncbi:AMP-binding enzyme, partial [Nocardia asteroides]|uniref:AMP-binding enzyme n=1 Tax=Nocardia asteroides TaxID=1824 RepID=UPI003409744B
PAVSQAAVLVVDTATGQQLVAYVVPAPGQSADPATLRAGLRRSLPSIMIPQSVVVLDCFPLNASGKLDRKSLPAAPKPDVASGRLPQTDSELIVAKVFSGLLNVSDIPVDADFYAMGGNSMLAFQAHDEIEEATGVVLPLRDFFQTPTIESVSSVLDNIRATS